jgi:hypothetical protein
MIPEVDLRQLWEEAVPLLTSAADLLYALSNLDDDPELVDMLRDHPDMLGLARDMVRLVERGNTLEKDVP